MISDPVGPGLEGGRSCRDGTGVAAGVADGFGDAVAAPEVGSKRLDRAGHRQPATTRHPAAPLALARRRAPRPPTRQAKGPIPTRIGRRRPVPYETVSPAPRSGPGRVSSQPEVPRSGDGGLTGVLFDVSVTNMKIDRLHARFPTSAVPDGCPRRERGRHRRADPRRAVEAFWEGPTVQLSLDDIATRAGVTVQTVIRRFGGKDGVIAAAVERETAKVAATRDPALVTSPVEAIRQLVDHYEAMGDRSSRCLPRRSGRRPSARSRNRPALPSSVVRAGVRRRTRSAGRANARPPSRPAGRGLRRLHVEAAASRRGTLPPADGARDARAARAASGGILMARVLAYTSPARGHLFPLTSILAELRERGHDVALRTMASQVPLMRELGFDAAPIDPQIEAIKHDDWQASSQRAALGRSVATFLARARHDGPDLRTAIAETDPDVVIVDINAWGRWRPPRRGVDSGPASAPIRCRSAHATRRRSARGLRRPAAHSAGSVIARQAGRPRHRRADDDAQGQCRADRARARAGQECRCPVRPPAAPPVPDRRTVRVPASRLAGERGHGRPVRLGSGCHCAGLARAGHVTDRAGHDLLGVPGRRPAGPGRARRAARGTCVRGGDAAGRRSGALRVPTNARVERFVPHRWCWSGRPSRSPTAVWAPPRRRWRAVYRSAWCPSGATSSRSARRVEVAGAGTRLPAKRLTPERLREKVRQAMGCGEGARRVADGYVAAGGPRAAADAIERRLGVTLTTNSGGEIGMRPMWMEAHA